MTLRFRFFFLLVILGIRAVAQTPPPPPPPPPPPIVEEVEYDYHYLNAKVVTLDELLNPQAYYEVSDEIFFETPDSIKAAGKISRCYFMGDSNPGAEPPDMINYAWYDANGRVQQTATFVSETGDSIVHRWKRNTSGLLTCYCSLTFEKKQGSKRNIDGDSVLFKYDVKNQLLEENRYAVMRVNGTKSDYFVSKTSYKYDAAGKLISKTSGGFTHSYSYDSKGRPTIIKQTGADKNYAAVDSLSWLEGAIADTIEHWVIIGNPAVRICVDMLMVNRTTGDELRYILFLPEKLNFIRDVMGPIDVRMSYDAGGRMIQESYYSSSDTLLEEIVFTYNDKGIITSVAFTHIYDPNQYGPPPPMANGHNNLYISSVISYRFDASGSLPNSLTLDDVLFDLKPESRYKIADRTHPGIVTIVQEKR